MAANPLIPLYGSLYGSAFFVAILSTAFYAVTCVQTLFYFIHYHNDPLRIKSFAGAIWVLDTIHEGLTVSGAYKYIMTGLKNPSSIATGSPELVFQVLLTGLIATTAQGFFIYRIFVFSGKNIIVPLVWIPLAIYQFLSATVYVARALYSADHSIHVTKLSSDFFRDVIESGLSIAAAVDVLTAVFMTFLLLRKRNSTGYSSVAHILQRLIVFAINTGMWTAVFALMTVILLHSYPKTLRYAIFGVPLCSVYCNTLLANLNVRVYFRDEIKAQTVDLQTSEESNLKSGSDMQVSGVSGENELLRMESEQLERHRGATFLIANQPKESDNVHA